MSLYWRCGLAEKKKLYERTFKIKVFLKTIAWKKKDSVKIKWEGDENDDDVNRKNIYRTLGLKVKHE